MAAPQLRSGLGRPLDLAYRSNVVAVVITALSGIGFGAAVVLASWSPWRAFAATLGVFLAWALGREVDPGRPVTATVAAVAAVVIAVSGAPALLMVFASMIVVRSIVGSVGVPLQPLDLGVVGIVGWASGGDLWLWPVGLWMLGYLMIAPEPRRLRAIAVPILIVPFVVAWYLSDVVPLTLDAAGALGAAGALIAGVISVFVVDCTEDTDLRETPIRHLRVRLGRIAAATVVASAFLGLGTEAVWVAGPVVAVVGALLLTTLTVPLFRGARRILRGRDADPD